MEIKESPDHAKHVTTTDFNKLYGELFNAILKQAKFKRNIDFEQCAIENKEKNLKT